MIRKMPIIYFLILCTSLFFVSFSNIATAEVQTVEIKLLVQKEVLEVTFIAQDKINFDIINEKDQLKVISYSPVKFIYTAEGLPDTFLENNPLTLKINNDAQGFTLTGDMFVGSVTTQIEKKLNSFSYIFNKKAQQTTDSVSSKNTFFNVKDQQWYFNFEDKTAAAVFFRENFLWVVFSEYKKFEITPEVLALDANIKNIIQIPAQEQTIIRFELHKIKKTEIRKEEANWVLNWKDENNPQDNRQSINQYLSPQAKGVFFPINDYVKKIIEVLDPDMQDTLKIIMSEAENQGVDNERNFVDFKLAKTIQGMVISIFNDNSYIKTLENGIEVILPEARIIKNDIDLPEFFVHDSLNPDKTNDENPILSGHSLLTFKIPNDLNFRDDFLNILNTHKEGENLENFESLAKFFFMHQLYKECAGIVNKISFQTKDQEVLLQGAIANYYIDRLNIAEKILNQLIKINAGKNQEELSFWQNLIEYSLAKPATPIGFLSYEKKFLKEYPNEIRSKIAIQEIEGWLEKNKNLDQVPVLLEILEHTAFKRKNLAYIKYLKSMYYMKKKAYNIWEELIKSYDPRCQMLATVALVECLLAEYKISHLEAIDRLMHARYMWRGGIEEYNILKRIKELYIQVGDKVSALSIIKLMLEYDLPNNNSFYLVAELSKLLTEVFLNYPDLKDVKGLSLFYEFKEMIPIGTLGDEIILGIAKRMINLEMIDQATAILEHQLKFRQNDLNKVLIGADLTEVYILDNQPKKALNALLEIKNIYTDGDLQKRQKYLLAKVYLKLDKYQLVKKVLENDFSHEANEILIDTYFKEQKWSSLQIVLELEVFQMQPDQDISEKSKNYIEKLLFCYYIQGHTNAIEELRKMLDKNGLSKQYDAFNLLTEFLQRDLVSVSSKNIKEYLSLENLETFLNSYKNYIKLPIKQSN
jgi:hypothetical protein